jgi:hypothetical protein
VCLFGHSIKSTQIISCNNPFIGWLHSCPVRGAAWEKDKDYTALRGGSYWLIMLPVSAFRIWDPCRQMRKSAYSPIIIVIAQSRIETVVHQNIDKRGLANFQHDIQSYFIYFVHQNYFYIYLFCEPKWGQDITTRFGFVRYHQKNIEII